MAITFTNIGSVTVGSGGAANISFSSISGTYTDLCLKFSGRNVNNVFTFSIGLNGSTVTSSLRLYTTGSGAGNIDTFNGMYTNYSAATASIFGSAEIYIANYSSNVNKSISIDAISESNATSAYMNLASLTQTSTSAITSITLIPESGNFAQYSTAVLYGIKKS